MIKIEIHVIQMYFYLFSREYLRKCASDASEY